MPKHAVASLPFRVRFHRGPAKRASNRDDKQEQSDHECSWITITQRSDRLIYVAHVFSPDQLESITLYLHNSRFNQGGSVTSGDYAQEPIELEHLAGSGSSPIARKAGGRSRS